MNNLPMNNLPMNNLPMNGLSQESLAVHRALFDVLATTALRQDLFENATLASALVSPPLKPGQVSYAPELMKYIAACALDPCDWIDAPPGLSADTMEKLADYSVITGDEADRKRKGFVGELGLCGAGSKDTRWATDPPRGKSLPIEVREPCLERVSACMLARTNALEAKVMISLRGEGLAPSLHVPTNTMFREHNGTPIASFSPSASCTSQERTNRHGNCGWQPLFVGQCVHSIDGEHVRRVSLAVEGESREVELRVCEGIFGCDDREGQPITVVGGSKTRPPYAGDLVAARTDGVTFNCPDQGPPDEDGHATGYFAVMARTRDGHAIPGNAVRPRFEAPGLAHDHYPAAEGDVFTYREGSFFGNLFTKIPPEEERRPIMLGGDQFACFSNIWNEGVAMFEQRICANVTKKLPEGCFANIPGPCDPRVGPSTPCPSGMPCLKGPKMVAGMCASTKEPQPLATRCETSLAPYIARSAKRWEFPYTTYLNKPCDLIGPRCEAFLATRPAVP